ncbi:MAG: Trk system potassium transporter TrkA [Clostridiaceae bacterium]|nr:Trk system potassium transporter TrkA [Clostridiaceae bacterium]
MKIIIVGDGKVGLALTRQLSREDHDITVIDSNPRVNETLEKYDVMIVNGNGASLETLREAGVAEADLVIAATSSDEINMLCCVTAKYFADVHTIARVRNPAYAEQLVQLRSQFGLSMTINPERQAANEIVRLLQYPSFLKRESFAKGRIEIVELEVKAGSRIEDLALHQLYQVSGGILVCAVERKGEITIPNGSFVLRAGDHIHVTAQAIDLSKLLKTLEITPQRVRQVLVVGGSRTAYHLSKRLLKMGMGVKIIEQQHDRCLELADLLPKATIIEGDGSQFQLLLQEGIAESDAVVTLTNMDEENIVISLYANHVGVPKVITKVNRMEYTEIFDGSGLGSIISPRDLCSASIVHYVRAMGNTPEGGSMLSLHRMIGDRLEALEFAIGKSTRYIGTPLKNIPLRKGVLMSCITHRGKTIIPNGDSCFYPEDIILVVTSSERPIQQLDEIFV